MLQALWFSTRDPWSGLPFNCSNLQHFLSWISPRCHMLTIDLLFYLFPSVSYNCLNPSDFIRLLSLCKFFMAHGRFTAASAAWAHCAYLSWIPWHAYHHPIRIYQWRWKWWNEQKKDFKRISRYSLHSLHFQYLGIPMAFPTSPTSSLIHPPKSSLPTPQRCFRGDQSTLVLCLLCCVGRFMLYWKTPYNTSLL